MSVFLNHTVIPARDAWATARFWSEMYGMAEPVPFGPFVAIPTDNDVSLDFVDHQGEPSPRHFAFLVSEDVFDVLYAKILDKGLDHWADPHQHRPNEFNTNDGGRGVYFLDIDGNYMEALTRPYGG